MKPCRNIRPNTEGSVLMVTLFAAVLIGTVLASYLTLIRHQDVAVARSQGWNAALTVAEAGAEEAMAQINAGAGSFSYDLSANGWGPPSGGNFNLQSRTLAGGRYDVRYFTNSASPNPTIYSTGYVTMPALSATVARQIKVSTKSTPLLNVAAVAKYGIVLTNGSGFTADSYDSADPANNGHYPAGNPSKQYTNADVGSVFGPVSLGGSPFIKGDLFLGPSAANSVLANQVSGKIATDFNADYPDVLLPPGAAFWPPAPDNGTTHDFQSSGDYQLSDTKKIVVRTGSKVRVYVTITNFTPISVTVESSNAFSGTLTIYQAAGTASFIGSGNLAIQSQRPENFWYYGCSNVTAVTYSGGGNNFYGVIYAPSASLFLNDGWNNMNLMGSCISKSITMNGRYNLHFDENLIRIGPIRGYIPNGWEEL